MTSNRIEEASATQPAGNSAAISRRLESLMPPGTPTSRTHPVRSTVERGSSPPGSMSMLNTDVCDGPPVGSPSNTSSLGGPLVNCSARSYRHSDDRPKSHILRACFRLRGARYDIDGARRVLAFRCERPGTITCVTRARDSALRRRVHDLEPRNRSGCIPDWHRSSGTARRRRAGSGTRAPPAPRCGHRGCRRGRPA